MRAAILAILLALATLAQAKSVKPHYLAYDPYGNIKEVTKAEYSQGWKTSQWVSLPFDDLQSLTAFLNTLPLPVASEAKVVLSNRSTGWRFITIYVLIYRDPR